MDVESCERTVLVVEDDRDVQESIVEVLEDARLHAIRASNGRDALERLRELSYRPCLILLDLMMPEMDGWQFRAEQRKDPALDAIPVVVLTAHANASELSSALEVQGFLKKPVSLDRLMDTIARFCPVLI